MNFSAYRATTVRVMRQLLADKRTVSMILAVPTLLLILLYYVFSDLPAAPLPAGEPSSVAGFPRIALTMLGILPMVVMFLVTSVAMQRERASGTLERLWTTPLHRLDLILGYCTAFAVTAVIQSLILFGVAFWFLDVETRGASWWVLAIALIDSIVGVALGLFTSAFSRNEFQAVQFMPVIVGPQLFLCGLFVATEDMPVVLEWAARVMPMTYAVDALNQVRDNATATGMLFVDFLVLAGVGALALVLSALTMPRKTN
ncbi:ABC transporter permease [Corynebacterium uberis]|uniref:ABC transporter permease n=1 Tax=Corynebacterium TaxID=1716 RepID=UPI001D0AB6EA|nr:MULTISPECIES: ABC transporter permease [Corynebacterium]MCZ9308679.1 ABC transporter permease [Corynebacterium sp. c6VSa_13]UDL74318.1 ABC transporter permease [Corynebacterium uberis]UDL76849.1 ABC transporter permease [Corynebacterium uberis]UDL79062.1 ABC transporter permease [Corynebacterium uberis]UDL79300.1 ABC transporter permease [Corynebacterium uberis]